MFDNLTDDNFILCAMKYYDNPQCKNVEEFYDDLNHFKYLKRLLRRNHKSPESIDNSVIRLILNHLTIIYNVFDPNVATRLLFFKIEDTLWPYLKCFIDHLGFSQKMIFGVNGNTIIISNIKSDSIIIEKLKEV